MERDRLVPQQLVGLFTDWGGQVDALKPDPIGVPNGACIDPSMALTSWV